MKKKCYDKFFKLPQTLSVKTGKVFRGPVVKLLILWLKRDRQGDEGHEDWWHLSYLREKW